MEIVLWGENEECDLYTCDFSKDGKTFATAGKDATIRVYDAEQNKCITSLSKDTPTTSRSHTMRVYSVVYHDKDMNCVFSGSWDNTVLMWDLRAGDASMIFPGPNICGDSIDVMNNTLLTGSWRHNKPLELWDIRTGNVIRHAEWGTDEFCNIYSAKFCHSNGDIVAGGSESSVIKVFTNDLKVISRVGVFKESVNSVAFSHNGETVVGADHTGSLQAFSSNREEGK
jgi:WD40 repeat protein